MDRWLISEEGQLQTIKYERYMEKRKVPFRDEEAKTSIWESSGCTPKRIAENKNRNRKMLESIQ